MKTIEDIRKLTEDALAEKSEQNRLELIKKQERLEKEKKERLERAKDISVFVQEIEGAAKKGENTYSISLGENDGSEYDELRKKYIKEYLSEFNPQFENVSDCACSYNYDGDAIDGTERYYTSTKVTFNW